MSIMGGDSDVLGREMAAKLGLKMHGVLGDDRSMWWKQEFHVCICVYRG